MTNVPIFKDNLSLSIISHGQLDLIRSFLNDFRMQEFGKVELILTLNIPENESVLAEFLDLPLTIIRNTTPKGFGANHNFAFSKSRGNVFVIVNPDIRLKNFRMDSLLVVLRERGVGACAPIVLSSTGKVEDSVRRYPTLVRLLSRVIFRRRSSDYTWGTDSINVDWVAGMFVAFKREAFVQVGGFDERFFLYMEDADICRRLKKNGWRTVLQPAASAIHDAQRASRRSLKHLRWHVASAFRFLFLS